MNAVSRAFTFRPESREKHAAIARATQNYRSHLNKANTEAAKSPVIVEVGDLTPQEKSVKPFQYQHQQLLSVKNVFFYLNLYEISTMLQVCRDMRHSRLLLKAQKIVFFTRSCTRGERV